MSWLEWNLLKLPLFSLNWPFPGGGYRWVAILFTKQDRHLLISSTSVKCTWILLALLCNARSRNLLAMKFLIERKDSIISSSVDASDQESLLACSRGKQKSLQSNISNIQNAFLFFLGSSEPLGYLDDCLQSHLLSGNSRCYLFVYNDWEICKYVANDFCPRLVIQGTFPDSSYMSSNIVCLEMRPHLN